MKQNAPSAPLPQATHGLRRFLYCTAATTGGVILIVEILGAKMLAPFVGTSHFVWTAQICITLIALAAGYWLGGWLVDRSPALRQMYLCILAAAVYLCLIVPLVEPVSYFFLRFGLSAGALLASAFLFFVPLTLLAAVGPFCIRVLSSSLSVVGTQAGTLFAVSTFGSVGGTVLISYVLVPFMPNALTMYLTAGTLVLLSGTYFAIWERRSHWRNPTILALLSFSLMLAGWWFGSARPYQSVDELYKANSNFGMIQVLQDKDETRRFYLNDYLVQNTYHPKEKHSLSMFTYMLHGLTRAYAQPLERVLCIGLGIGIVPMQLASEGVQVDVVEINPEIIPVAEEYFDLDPTRMDIAVGDGRFYVRESTNRYDAIVLDAFLGDSSPSHLMSREAFGEMREILNPGGVLVINSFGNFAPGKDFFIASLQATLASVFNQVRIHTAGNGNVFFVAAQAPALEVQWQPDWSDLPLAVRSLVQAAFATSVTADLPGGLVLTDDYNPAEFFDARNREDFRRQVAASMREL